MNAGRLPTGTGRWMRDHLPSLEKDVHLVGVFLFQSFQRKPVSSIAGCSGLLGSPGFVACRGSL